mmetsp:Transcript_15490/g.48734  ORF Transcript_15490/g.48734 Transcript_15490/m.48734 type:complete len:728 (+) Transcript_15490:185-2368(+)
MLIPTFQLHLQDSILTQLATVGYYNGKHPSLTCGTNAGKIFIHSPHAKSEDGSTNHVQYLNIQKQVTGVAAGALDPAKKRDMLMVGTMTDLLAYDVDENSDVFFKEVPDGVSAMIFGRMGSVDAPLAIVGGNCSIQGFDVKGEEQFWTVAGDNVSAMAFCDIDNDGINELLVGSEDFEIRIFQNDEVVCETTEADRVVGLCGVVDTRYGYALANGTIGVYDRSTRVWRVKSKNQVTCIEGFDLDGDGVPELISGWSNGKLEVRAERTGEVVFRDNFTQALSAIVKADYRMDGRDEVICCGSDGEVRGYLPGGAELGGQLMDNGEEEAALVELNQRKQELLWELKSYESNLRTVGIRPESDTPKVNAQGRVLEDPAAAVPSGPASATATVIPPSTHVSSRLEVSAQGQCCDLVITTNNETVIKGVIIFAEQLFDDESVFYCYRAPASTVAVPIAPRKDIATDMLIKVLVGTRTSPIFHVFELDYRLPKFAMYVLVRSTDTPQPLSSVALNINERVSRVALWISQAFNVEADPHGETVDCTFVSMRDGRPIVFSMTPENGGTLTIRSDDMDVCGEIIQDLAASLSIETLEAVADFPYDMEAFRSILLQVDEYNAVRLKLTAEVADSSQVVKTMVIKAEDARILADMDHMRQMYANLYDLNRELMMEHTKRATNHTALLAALKEVNQMIQKAARLRVGAPKTRVVAACRQAIKSNNIHSLFKIIKLGDTA